MRKVDWDVKGTKNGVTITIPRSEHIVLLKYDGETEKWFGETCIHELHLLPQDAFALMGKISMALFDFHTLSGKAIDEPACK